MQLKNFENIKNIIFDLGNVIINLDEEATRDAFESIFGGDYDNVMEELQNDKVFEKYETGNISTQTFLNELGAFAEESNHDELRYAWNAMLLDIPKERYKLLEKCKNEYKTFCLSNTNKLHIDFIYKNLKKTKNIDNLNGYFDKVYLSHEIKMRKPNTDIFEKVLKENGLNPSETLFIDDTEGHLEGAKSLGIQTFHLTEDIDISDLFI